MTVARPDAPNAEARQFESIEELFAALESPLLSYALRLLDGRAQAEDAVQEAFMKLHAQFAKCASQDAGSIAPCIISP